MRRAGQPIHTTVAIREFLSLDGPDRLYVVAPKGYGKTPAAAGQADAAATGAQGADPLALGPACRPAAERPADLDEGGIRQLRPQLRLLGRDLGDGRQDRRSQAVPAPCRTGRGLRCRRARRRAPLAADCGTSSRSRSSRCSARSSCRSCISTAATFYALREDVIGQLNPLFRGIHTGIAFFIDNVDECLERSLVGDPRRGAAARRAPPTRAGCWSPGPWRSSPWRAPPSTSPAQPACPGLCGAAPGSLAAPGRCRCRRGADERPGRRDRLRAGGPEGDLPQEHRRRGPGEALRPRMRRIRSSASSARRTPTLVHEFSGSREDFFSFVLRHTLLRPRELMAIGNQIVADPAGPAQRRPAEGGRPPGRGRECPVLPGGG